MMPPPITTTNTGVAYFKLCATYRTTFVLAREKAAWKIVHQHYSEPIWID